MSEEEKSVEALRAENDALRKRMEKLENQVNPPPRPASTRAPVDYTANASMPRSAMKAMVDALPSSFYSDLRSDARKQNPVTGGPNPKPQPQVQRGSGWVEPRPLESPPGLKYVDAQIDAQDAKDRAELIERELKLAKARMGKGDVK